jgi:hypothetical protein
MVAGHPRFDIAISPRYHRGDQSQVSTGDRAVAPHQAAAIQAPPTFSHRPPVPRTLGYDFCLTSHGVRLLVDERGLGPEVWDDELGYIESHNAFLSPDGEPELPQ